MIFIDSSEKHTNFPTLYCDHIWIDNLETLTGADVMVSIESEPLPTTTRKVNYHLKQGAFLIQFKLGLDIASSVGPRMHSSLHRMLELESKNPQRVLACVGILTDRDGAYIDGREAIPSKPYRAVAVALNRWGDRGGVVNWVAKKSLIEEYLTWKENDIQVYRNDYVKEAWPPKSEYPDDPGDILQVLVPVEDWRVTLRAMPRVRLGPKKLNALQDDIITAGEPNTLLSALQRLTYDGSPKTKGIGKGIKANIRTHLGLRPGQNIVISPHFPAVLEFPANANVGVVSGQWEKLKDGRVRATYKSQEELALCIAAVGEHSDRVWKAVGVKLDG